MRCNICDKEDNLIAFDRERKEFPPCSECQAVIQEALDDFPDEEEELTED